mmetsp:Transcript_33989/g.59231  ORF Transcript_33989/g.59231 Transcript_33989/m.59231 type:complete len:511 (+) Transcript_33989:41-1573(+)
MAQEALAIQLNAIDPDLLRVLEGVLTESCTKVSAQHLKEIKAISVEEEIKAEKEKAKAADIENAIRQQKLREAIRMKQELEEKLSHVKESIDTIEMLKPPVEDEATKKKSLLDKNARAEYYEEMQRKQLEAEKKARKLAAEQAERKRRAEEQHKKLMETMLSEDVDLQRMKEQRQAEIEEKKQEKIRTMQQKLAQRRAEREKLMQVGVEEFQKVKAAKPLYVQIEEKYKQEILMPELEKHKAELAKKRIHFNSVSRQELTEHAKRYEEMKRENMERRSLQANESTLDHMANLASKNSSKFTYAVIEEERQKREEKTRIAEERRRMMEKQKQYASLIKEIYVPVVDPNKKAEIDGRREKHSTAPVKNRAESEKAPRSAEENMSNSASWRPRKFKPNSLAPPPPPEKKDPVKVDYLGDRRRERETSEVRVSRSLKNFDLDSELQSSNLSDKEGAARLIEKAQKMERAARRQELSLSQNLKTEAHVDALGSVNDALVNSVKAKLALLDSVTRK